MLFFVTILQDVPVLDMINELNSLLYLGTLQNIFLSVCLDNVLKLVL